MKAALQVHPTRVTGEILEQDILPALKRCGIDHHILPTGHYGEAELESTDDLVIAVGGDGTFLAGARLAARYGLPVLGVMVGRLGFLCTVSLADLVESLEQIVEGRMLIEERSLLRGRIIGTDGDKFSETAINDVVVHRLETENLRDFTARYGGELIAHYRADGIILASATGSTAYTLSAGGPLVHPVLNVLTLTPICAHSLFSKPLVLPPSKEVEILGRDRSYPLSASFDGAIRVRMEEGDRLVVSEHNGKLKVYRPEGYDFFEVLRQKLQHGYIFGANDD